MINKFRKLLYEKKVINVEVDDNALLSIHASILQEKKLLKSAFEYFYLEMTALCDCLFIKHGIEIELGSGAGFLKKIRPNVITSDIRRGPTIDMELDAQNMNISDASVRCIYGINVFHHLPSPHKFFKELERVLQIGGGCILVEPHKGFFSSLLHKHLHTDEYFDLKEPEWDSSKISGPLSGANQAKADIVFERDLVKFNKLHGKNLEIVYKSYALNGFRYFLSGGLNFHQLVPSCMIKPLIYLEKILSPLSKYWTLHQIIVIKRKN
jgi:SAM-dependent methyltransferase